MISVSGKKWEEKKTNKNSIEKLKQDYNFSDILSKLVISKEFDTTELSSIDNNLDLNNVFLKNNDFEESIKLLDSIDVHVGSHLETGRLRHKDQVITNHC